MSVSTKISRDKAQARSIKVTCAFCQSGKMHSIIDFGDVALAGGFLKKEDIANEPKFPLRLFFCTECFAVQVVDVVEPELLFNNYFYFSSAIRSLKEHFVDYAMEVSSRFLNPEESTVVEFGCNDGILLKPFADQKVRTLIGVDPATNVINTIQDPRINTINDFFGPKVGRDIETKYGKADLIVANNVYAHIPDINGVTAAVRDLLKEDGVFVFEVHYLGKVIEGLQYDMIYHEHLYYHSLIALQNHFSRYDMTVFDVKPIPIHGGSMRYYVAKNTSKYAKSISARVDLLKRDELTKGYNKIETYSNFGLDVALRKEKLMDLLARLKKKGRSIAGYGASGRANTIIQYSGITSDYIDFMIDDAPAKEGYCTPGSHFEIYSNRRLQEDRPDYLLIFAWGYFNEIAEKCRGYLAAGGRMITPLPDVKVVFSPINDADL
ncbi:MAG: class I SAM-dependent methyltransferase [Candidatus Melainabacteria bacterium]|nr:class I SAM-dependent methyltransferase [Candidatus Melainabacteria bacterium]